MIFSEQHTDASKETDMTTITRTLAGLAIGAVGVLAAAGAYAETHRAPDQP